MRDRTSTSNAYSSSKRNSIKNSIKRSDDFVKRYQNYRVPENDGIKEGIYINLAAILDITLFS